MIPIGQIPMLDVCACVTHVNGQARKAQVVDFQKRGFVCGQDLASMLFNFSHHQYTCWMMYRRPLFVMMLRFCMLKSTGISDTGLLDQEHCVAEPTKTTTLPLRPSP